VAVVIPALYFRLLHLQGGLLQKTVVVSNIINYLY
jgi:hypothetical protein